MIMSMRRCRQALRARDNELKGRDGATRVFSSDQEAYRERPETDGLVGRIDVEADGLLCHVCIFFGKWRLSGYYNKGQFAFTSGQAARHLELRLERSKGS